MIDINLKSRTPEFEYFSTGKVIAHEEGEPVCDVWRTEGGKLVRVPILGMFGGGGQSNDIWYMGSLVGCFVALIKIQGIYCVLGTIPDFASESVSMTHREGFLSKEDA